MAVTVKVNTVNSVNKLIQLEPGTTITNTLVNTTFEGADDRCFFLVDNSAGTSTLSVTLGAGSSKAKSIGSVEAGKNGIFYFDSQSFTNNGTTSLAITPANNGAKITAIEFIPVKNN